MDTPGIRRHTALVLPANLFALTALLLPCATYAQTSPFDTGANSAVDFAFNLATPVAILIVLAAGGAAAVGRISWGWAIGGIVGIAVIFGSPQIVAWIRGMFGV